MNRSVQINPNGTFAIPNVPVEAGFFRIRVTCKQDGITIGGQSEFVELQPDLSTAIDSIVLGTVDPIPVSLQVTSPLTTLTTSNSRYSARNASLHLNGA
ncbi:hypothetical protein, partial [Candidatus Entotheonella palauensis]|uniref:hypothetical protein n=1 Tax=Candidatus Entotheonella palauensis TaxID=93172 RepID=UPI001C4E2A8C